MKKRLLLTLTIIIITIISLAACTQIEDQISKEEAQELVIEKHSKSIGNVEIRSIEVKRNKYIVEWENVENLERGIDKVDKKGNVKMIEAEIE